MRIAIVRQRYNPYGGAERFIERALPALERAGAEVTLIARRFEGWGARRVLRVDPFHLGNVWRDWSFARAARKAWHAGGFDLVQSHERIPGCDIYRAGDGVHRRWLEIRRAGARPLERVGIALNPYHRYVCAAERAVFEHPALRAVICNSNMVREEILAGFRIPAHKLHVIYNGVDLEFFHPGRRAHMMLTAREDLGIGAGEVVFLFVGSGFARKGLDTAIDAMALLPQEAFRLVVVGRDRDQRRFAARARAAGVGRKVQFVGPLEDVSPLYAAAQCLVLPTRYDPFPNVVPEALAMGIPAIVSERCGAAEIVRAARCGAICEPDDAEGLAHLMRRIAQDPGHEAMRAAARRAAEPLSLGAMSARLLELYRSLL